MFKDRFDAGRQLAEKLQHYRNRDSVVVAVPRGGIELGYEIAKALDLPLEVVLTKKLGHPHQREFAIGAVSLESRILQYTADVSPEYIESETERVREMLRQRQQQYYGSQKPEPLRDRIVIIVDDGIATGNTLLSSIELIEHQQPRMIVVAVPVASSAATRKIKERVDEFICLLTPPDFQAVGQYYEQFYQVKDEEVIALLERIRKKNNGNSKSQERAAS